jgi:hypothetical protein
MARSRVNYSSGFKDEAVGLVVETSRPVADVAREVSVHEGTSGVLGEEVSPGPRRVTNRSCRSPSGPGSGSWRGRTASSA